MNTSAQTYKPEPIINGYLWAALFVACLLASLIATHLLPVYGWGLLFLFFRVLPWIWDTVKHEWKTEKPVHNGQYPPFSTPGFASYSNGKKDGFAAGKKEGHDQGFSQGFEKGFSEGKMEGTAAGIKKGAAQERAKMGNIIASATAIYELAMNPSTPIDQRPDSYRLQAARDVLSSPAFQVASKDAKFKDTVKRVGMGAALGSATGLGMHAILDDDEESEGDGEDVSVLFDD